MLPVSIFCEDLLLFFLFLKSLPELFCMFWGDFSVFFQGHHKNWGGSSHGLFYLDWISLKFSFLFENFKSVFTILIQRYPCLLFPFPPASTMFLIADHVLTRYHNSNADFSGHFLLWKGIVEMNALWMLYPVELYPIHTYSKRSIC